MSHSPPLIPSTQPTLNSRSMLYLLLALALVRGVMYATLVPPWQAPDEPAQFERAKAALDAEEWQATSVNGPAWYNDLIESLFIFSAWDFIDVERPTAPGGLLNQYIVPYNEAYQGQYSGRFPYMLIGWPLMVAADQPLLTQLYLLRLNTVLMNVGIIFFAYLITQTIFPGHPFLTWGVPLLILFNPQHTHLLATVNNGNLAELLATATLYFLVRGLRQGFSFLTVSVLGLLTILAMWTKATAYFLPFAIGSVGLVYGWRYRRHWFWLLPVGAITAAVVYFLAPARLRTLLAWSWERFNNAEFYLDPLVPADLFRSFWALPGWFVLVLHPFWYWLWGVVCIVALVGWVGLGLKHYRALCEGKYAGQARALLALLTAAVVAISVPLIYSTLFGDLTYRQGRSIYPVIVPIYLFILLGWTGLIPPRWRGEALVAITAGLFLFDALVLFHYIVPFFYSRL
ncbi:MAG TPA: hypothetical protein PKE64_10425 [Anaerolineae bacterium]|nr:hypothetical protein [Anaerolineae bacterium]